MRRITNTSLKTMMHMLEQQGQRPQEKGPTCCWSFLTAPCAGSLLSCLSVCYGLPMTGPWGSLTGAGRLQAGLGKGLDSEDSGFINGKQRWRWQTQDASVPLEAACIPESTVCSIPCILTAMQGEVSGTHFHSCCLLPPSPTPQAWCQWGKVYILTSLKPWAVMNLSMTSGCFLLMFLFFLNQLFCHNDKKSNYHGTCQLFICCSLRNYFPSISVVCSFIIYSNLFKLTTITLSTIANPFFIFPYGHIGSNNFPVNDSPYMPLHKPKPLTDSLTIYGDVCTTMKSPNYALLREVQLFPPHDTLFGL